MYILGTKEGIICVIEPASKYLISFGNIMNGYPIMGSILANFVKGITWGNIGNIMGLLVILDASTKSNEYTFILPPITTIEFDEQNLEIYSNTLIGKTFVSHYVTDMSRGILRNEATVDILETIVDEDLNLFFVLAKNVEMYDLLTLK
jgi:hypothetical protein